MGHTCILTDNAAQFTRPNFPGYKHINCFNSSLELQKGSIVDLQDVKVGDFPIHVNSDYPIRLIPPSKDALAEQVIALNSLYDDVFIILVSKDLSTNYEIFEDTVKKFHGKADIHLLDSESIAIGEGQIIQMAANMIEKTSAQRLSKKPCGRQFLIFTRFFVHQISPIYINRGSLISVRQSAVNISDFFLFLPLRTGSCTLLKK